MAQQTPLAFEEIVQSLEALVHRLESGGLSLDEALKLYEQGIALTRQGNSMLEGVEKRIIELQSAKDEGLS